MNWRSLMCVGLLASMAFAGVAQGCGDADDDSGGAADFDPGAQGGTGDDGIDDQGPVGGQSPVDPGDLPPEQEEQVSLNVPQAGRSVVYVANPLSHRVAAVNAETLVVETVRSGLAPTYLSTVPGEDAALVLNVGTRDASLLRTQDGETSLQRLEVGHDQNAIAMAPDGAHAVIYFDARQAQGLAQSYQDITVVDLARGSERARGVSVGFRPKAVQFSADGGRAFVVTEDGISIVDLSGDDSEPLIARTVSVGDSVTSRISTDVQVTPDGRYAVARREGDSSLRLVDLAPDASGTIHTLSVAEVLAAQVEPDSSDAGTDAGAADAGIRDGGTSDSGKPDGSLALTDLDLTPDGKTAYAVARGIGALLRIPLPDAFTDPSQVEMVVIDDLVVGSVSVAKSGSVAALYTTASPVEALVLLDLRGDAPPRSVRLRKAVRAVALSDDGSRALVLHTREDGEGSDDDARIDASEGFSLVNTQTGFAKLELTPARVREHQLVLTPDARRLFMLLRSDSAGVRALSVADLETFQVRSVELAQPPLSVGLLPGVNRVFVGEENEGGRITFFDRETGELVAALTGFELASRIAQ